VSPEKNDSGDSTQTLDEAFMAELTEAGFQLLEDTPEETADFIKHMSEDDPDYQLEFLGTFAIGAATEAEAKAIVKRLKAHVKTRLEAYAVGGYDWARFGGLRARRRRRVALHGFNLLPVASRGRLKRA
jgi:hypothetical protein